MPIPNGAPCAQPSIPFATPAGREESSAIPTATVPLAQIAPPGHDIKPDRTPEEILAKLESIRQQGVLSPLLVFLRPDAMYELLDGYTRFQALLMGGFKEAPIRDLGRVPSPAESLSIQVTCNLAHAEMSNLQLAEAIARHRKLTGGTQGAACKALGIKAVRGSKIMAMFKAPAEVLEMMAAGELKPRAVSALGRLSKMADASVVIALAKKARDLPMAVESIEEEVAKLIPGKKQKATKPVKARTVRGIQVIIPDLDFDTALAELKTVTDAVRKAQAHNLPLSAVPTLLKGT